MYYPCFGVKLALAWALVAVTLTATVLKLQVLKVMKNLPNGHFSSLQCEIAPLNPLHVGQLCTHLFGPIIFVGFYKQDQIHPPPLRLPHVSQLLIAKVRFFLFLKISLTSWESVSGFSVRFKNECQEARLWEQRLLELCVRRTHISGLLLLF